MKKRNLLGLILMLAVVLSGCATKPQQPRFVWPAPPDEPRLEYVGNFYSEQDLRMSKGSGIANSFLGRQAEIIFKTPFGIVSDGEGRVYISDLHVRNIWVFDFTKKAVGTITKRSLVEAPAGMVLDAERNLYVADIKKGRIVKFDPQHKFAATLEGGDMEAPTYLALSPDGKKLYVSESRKHRILIFDIETGQLVSAFGTRGTGEGQFNHPQGLAFGPQGRLFVADGLNARIQVFDAEGKFLSAFGERGDQPGQLESPKDLAFDSAGHLYIVEARSSVVKTFQADGQLLLVTGAGKPSYDPFGFNSPKSIFIDQADRIYVAESLGRRFTVWQYMSDEYLQRKPYSNEDRQRLLEHMEQVAAEREQ